MSVLTHTIQQSIAIIIILIKQCMLQGILSSSLYSTTFITKVLNIRFLKVDTSCENIPSSVSVLF